MREHTLTTGQVAFLVGTRAALAGGIGLLVSSKLSANVLRAVGIGLVVLGAVTTIPAARTLLKS